METETALMQETLPIGAAYFMRNEKARFDIEADKDADAGLPYLPGMERELPGEGTEAEYDEMCQRVLAGRRTRLAELREGAK